MGSFSSFEELDCWKVATELRREISKTIKSFPKEEKYELVSQIRRASRSVTNNIAEGFGRYHYQEFVQFCRVSRGSLTELIDHLIIACDEEYITDEVLKDYRGKIARCLAVLNGFINYLERAKENKSVKEPEEFYGTENIKLTNNE